jgi:two-component system sensor histidine kinase BaeS
MKFGIAAKLFLLLLATSVAVSVLMGVAARVSFKSGFLGYLNEQGIARLETLAPALGAEYERNGSFDFLKADPRSWIAFLRTTSRPASSPDLASVHLRMILLDTDRSYIAGYQRELGQNPIMRPVVAQGKTVGYLALRSQEQTLTDADLRFQKRQLIAAWAIGAGVVLFAALVAYKLSRTLVTPLKRIALATKQVANGDYASRVPASSNDEIGQLSVDFNTLADTLKRNEQLRRRFMADIAHELRTPLSVLRGELEAIQDRVNAPTPEAIASLHSEVSTLSKVVEDLYELSLADIGALTYRKASTDIGDVLQTTLDVFLHRFSSLGLKIETHIEKDAVCIADPHRIQQLFNNLLENMARYTQSPGELTLDCRQADGNVVIEFHNSGPGVSLDQFEQLFDEKLRADSRPDHAAGGAGLGLAICRKIVEAHEGNIAAQPSPLGGMLIRVQLPVQNPGGGAS